MKYCNRCVMPDTRPGITFNNENVCSACQVYENRNNIDWKARYRELEKLCSKYRGMNGNSYDCAIAVSGGKDSHYQVHIMKEIMNMNPILFSVEDNFEMTNAGRHNLKNISEAFSCNIISLKPDISTQKKIMRYTFEKHGKPTWIIDRLIYTYPLLMALKFNTPLLIYGENVSYEYGGEFAVDTYSAKNQLKNGVASEIPLVELISECAIGEKELWMTNAPSEEEMEKLDPIYLSYFLPWNSVQNYEVAKKMGFQDLTHEWKRTHHIEDFDQIESPAYLVHSWMKYPKFGHASATDYAAKYVRYGLITREEAVELVKTHDSNLDPRTITEFCDFLGYTVKEFWDIVDNFYNANIFRKGERGEWIPKCPIWKK